MKVEIGTTGAPVVLGVSLQEAHDIAHALELQLDYIYDYRVEDPERPRDDPDYRRVDDMLILLEELLAGREG